MQVGAVSDSPFFSIIIPTYNRVSLLKRATDSVFSQSYTNYELIIVDDGSEDNTREVVEKSMPTVRYVYQRNNGVCSARNNGARLAKGKYFIFLDSDDWLLPNTLTEFYQSSANNGDAELIMGISVRYNTENAILKTNHPKYWQGRLLQGLCGSFAIHNQLFNKLGGYDENLSYSENSDLFLRINYNQLLNINNTVIVNTGGVGLYVEPVRERRMRYSKKRFESTLFFIDKHQQYLNSSVKDFLNFKRILAVAAIQNEKIDVARLALREVLSKRPLSIKTWILYFLSIVLPDLLIRHYKRQ